MAKEKPDKAEGDLDDALKQTFPASDPVSLGGKDDATSARIDRAPAKLDVDLVDRLSREVKRKANATPDTRD